jgi:hypothetical protein
MAPRDGLQMLNRSASIALEERVALVAALVPNLEHFERCTAAPNVDTVARGYAVRAHVSGASAT